MSDSRSTCKHPAKDVIWTGEWEEEGPSPLNPFITVKRIVRRLYCLGCGREFEVEVL